MEVAAIWCIVPVLAGPELTEAALADLLAQSVPVRVLVINQGVDDAFRDRLERLAEAHPQLYLWSHVPPLPSLAATWNRALRFVWESGGTEALVVNNDVNLRADTVEELCHVRKLTNALLISAVGVTKEQFHREEGLLFAEDPDAEHPTLAKGGPDFSCFLISKEGHEKYPFDEGFIPAFCEDLDCHRRYLLGGDGARIFSINLPYLHYSSQTLKTLPPDQRARLDRQIETVCRVHYAKKWGGPVNDETFLRPFDPTSILGEGLAATPYLQAHPEEIPARLAALPGPSVAVV